MYITSHPGLVSSLGSQAIASYSCSRARAIHLLDLLDSHARPMPPRCMCHAPAIPCVHADRDDPPVKLKSKSCSPAIQLDILQVCTHGTHLYFFHSSKQVACLIVNFFQHGLEYANLGHASIVESCYGVTVISTTLPPF